MLEDIWKIAAAVALPNAGGYVAGRITRNHIENWYQTLKFPSYKPPSWVFPVVWTPLYTGMGYASYLVWRDGGGFSGPGQTALIAYGAQLALNFSWTPIFFGQHNIKGGLIDLLAITAAASACGVLFHRVNPTAGYIFVPYVAWLAFASLLNYAVYKLNPPSDKAIEGAGKNN